MVFYRELYPFPLALVVAEQVKEPFDPNLIRRFGFERLKWKSVIGTQCWLFWDLGWTLFSRISQQWAKICTGLKRLISWTILLYYSAKILEAASGVEPNSKVLQTLALPLGYAASSGLTSFSYMNVYQSLISRYKFIALREGNGCVPSAKARYNLYFY